MAQNRRFTTYDALEAKGAFSSNPANVGAQDDNGNVLYMGPVQFPKMLYHPTGAKKITIPATATETLSGVKSLGEQSEIISQIVKTPEEEAKLLAEGWHLHPSKAIGASGKTAPPIGANEIMQDQLGEIKRLRMELAALQAGHKTKSVNV